jgi:hypothetical protein
VSAGKPQPEREHFQLAKLASSRCIRLAGARTSEQQSERIQAALDNSRLAQTLLKELTPSEVAELERYASGPQGELRPEAGRPYEFIRMLRHEIDRLYADNVSCQLWDKKIASWLPQRKLSDHERQHGLSNLHLRD